MAYTNSSDDLVWGGVDSDMESGTINMWLYLDSDAIPSSNAPFELLTHTRQWSTYYRDRIRWRIEYDAVNGMRARLQLNSPATNAISNYSSDITLDSNGILDWHMHTVTWNKSTGAIVHYLDGAANGTSTDVLPAMSVPSTDTFVAGQITGPYSPTAENGIAKTAHLAIWKTAQASSDIANLYSVMTNNTAISMTLFPGATGIDAIFENPSPNKGYVTRLDIQGKRLKVYQPNTYTARNEPSQFILGQLKGSLDMTYQADPLVGKDAGDFLSSFLYLTRTRIDTVDFDAFRNANLELRALQVEPGDRVTLTNTHLGLSRDYWVNGVEGKMLGNNMMSIRLFLIRAFDVNFWLLGVPGYSELDQTAYLSY